MLSTVAERAIIVIAKANKLAAINVIGFLIIKNDALIIQMLEIQSLCQSS